MKYLPLLSPSFLEGLNAKYKIEAVFFWYLMCGLGNIINEALF
jgi:hypothetical protein